MAGYYRIFRPFYRVIIDINQSSDLIEKERFEDQIQRCRLRRSLNGNQKTKHSQATEQEQPKVKPARLNILARLWLFCRDIDMMIQFNKNTLFQFWLCCFLIGCIVYVAILCILYGCLPVEREPVTSLRKNLVLRFLESNNILDIMRNFEQPVLFNRVIAIYFIQYIILRLRHFKRRIDSARLNRDEYKNINIMQLQLSTADSFTYNLSDVIWIMTSWNHQCDLKSSEARKRHSIMREMTKQLKVADPMEKFYYCNQIDFELCYQGRTTEFSSTEDNNAAKTWASKLFLRLSRLFALAQPNRFSFCSRPKNRIDPPHLTIVFILYLATMVGVSSLLIMCLTMTLYPDFVASGFDLSNIPGTCLAALREYTSRVDLMVFALGSVMFQVIVALNSLDNGLLVFNALMCLSRSIRVIKLIELEVDWYRAQLEGFGYLVLESGVFKRAPTWLQHFAAKRRRLSSISMKKRILEDQAEVADFDKMLRYFRKSLKAKEVQEINQNMDYIVDLIGVLQREFSDMKQLTSLELNMNIIFSTCCSSIIILAMGRISSLYGFVLWSVLLIVITLPLLISLALGATSEGSFRKICKNINPVIHDLLGIMEPEVHYRLLKISQHLVLTENRSFVIMGNFSLTFGSMTSILGWIASCNLWLKRFTEQFD